MHSNVIEMLFAWPMIDFMRVNIESESSGVKNEWTIEVIGVIVMMC